MVHTLANVKHCRRWYKRHAVCQGAGQLWRNMHSTYSLRTLLSECRIGIAVLFGGFGIRPAYYVGRNVPVAYPRDPLCTQGVFDLQCTWLHLEILNHSCSS